MRAILFPGQGSQYVGMGSDFYQKFDLVKKIFKSVDENLGFSISKLILNGPEEELKLTQNTQPAIMTVGVLTWLLTSVPTGRNIAILKETLPIICLVTFIIFCLIF